MASQKLVRITEKQANIIADKCLHWAENEATPIDSISFFFNLYADLSNDEWKPLEQFPSFKKKIEKAQCFIAKKARTEMVRRKNNQLKNLLPLLDKEYKNWRVEELKISTVQPKEMSEKVASLLDGIKELGEKKST